MKANKNQKGGKWAEVSAGNSGIGAKTFFSCCSEYGIQTTGNIYIGGKTAKGNIKIICRNRKGKTKIFVMPEKYIPDQAKEWLRSLSYDAEVSNVPKHVVPIYDNGWSARRLLKANDDHELLEILYELSEEIDDKGIGFGSRHDAFFAEGPDAQERLRLLKYENVYITHVSGATVNGWAEDDLDTVKVFHTEEEAREYFNSSQMGIPYYKDARRQITDCLGSDCNVWFKADTELYGYSSRIEYCSCLIMDKFIESNDPEQDAEIIREEATRFDKLREQLWDKNLDIYKIYKKKEFPGNQRYYCFILGDMKTGCETTIPRHIPSAHQNTYNRRVLDYAGDLAGDFVKERNRH